MYRERSRNLFDTPLFRFGCGRSLQRGMDAAEWMIVVLVLCRWIQKALRSVAWLCLSVSHASTLRRLRSLFSFRISVHKRSTPGSASDLSSLRKAGYYCSFGTVKGSYMFLGYLRFRHNDWSQGTNEKVFDLLLELCQLIEKTYVKINFWASKCCLFCIEHSWLEAILDMKNCVDTIRIITSAQLLPSFRN